MTPSTGDPTAVHGVLKGLLDSIPSDYDRVKRCRYSGRLSRTSILHERDSALIFRKQLTFATRGRGTIEITDQILEVVEDSGIRMGLCHIFVLHTSASLIVCENADPTVRRDLERYAARLVPDGDPDFIHTLEGPDDMPAHIRTILTQVSLTLPVENDGCLLGTWQGIFLWEHRTAPHRRRIVVTVHGEETD